MQSSPPSRTNRDDADCPVSSPNCALDQKGSVEPAPASQMPTDKSLRAIFEQALEQPDWSDRTRFLKEACGSDAALRERVEALLKADEEAGGFLSHPSEERAQKNQGGLTEKPGDHINRYRLLQQIGEGGCGVVYMAEQEQPMRRRVALKIIKLGMDTKQVVARFEAERQALALMDHPNIARVLDGGATEGGRPFFVMELVRGVRLTEFSDQKKLSTRERLELFIQVCQAIQHAHQKGIIHRDLKPSNILVTIVDGQAVPKVIDFGIAKATNNQQLTDKTVFTAFEQFIGTPAYMSPEQAEMSGVDIDTRTDIYSLGVVLYELLTGKPPFKSDELLRSGIDGMRRTIRQADPPRPSTRLSTLVADEATTVAKARQMEIPGLVKAVRGDLDWIVMKCLEKERDRRYETVNSLALDIRRHLNSEAVSARPASRLYRLQKLMHRNQLAFAASATVLLVMLGGIGASSWQAIRATQAEQEQSRLRLQAQAQERKAQIEAARSAQFAQFMRDMLQGVGPEVARGRDTTLLRAIVEQTARRLKELKGQPEVEADLLATLGNVYLDLGDYTNAALMHQQALERRKQMFTEEHAEVAASLNDLGLVRCAEGKGNESESLHREALAMRRRLFGEENPEVAASLHNLGEALRLQHRYAEAETVHRAGLVLRRKLLGEEHPAVAQSLNNLGATVYGAGNAAAAEDLLRETLALRKRLTGDQQTAIAFTLDDLAWAETAQGKYAEAERACREGLEIRKAVLGENHRDVARSLGNLATIQREQGRLTNAEGSFRQVLEMNRKLYPALHPHIADTLLNLASTLQAEGRPGEAEPLYREALEMQRQLFGDASPRVASSLSFLALALLEQAKSAEAESAAREALVIRARLPENVQFPIFALRNLTRIFKALGKEADTEPLRQELSERESMQK
jgi:serine/threonine protein kinase